MGTLTQVLDLHKGFSGVGIRACGLPRYTWDVYQIGKRFLFFLALRGTRSISRGVGSEI